MNNGNIYKYTDISGEWASLKNTNNEYITLNANYDNSCELYYKSQSIKGTWTYRSEVSDLKNYELKFGTFTYIFGINPTTKTGSLYNTNNVYFTQFNQRIEFKKEKLSEITIIPKGIL